MGSFDRAARIAGRKRTTRDQATDSLTSDVIAGGGGIGAHLMRRLHERPRLFLAHPGKVPSSSTASPKPPPSL
jgi:hypothetical protein